MDAIAAPPGDTISEFCRDVIKQMALGAARTALLDDLKRRYALKRLTGMSPGAGDRNVWPIEQQKELFALLGDTRATVGVTLTDSCLMIPNKSVSGLLYASDVDFVACQLCHRQVCPGRKAPFDQALWKARMGEGNC
jgi:cobalamin-dependent methionine synthase I